MNKSEERACLGVVIKKTPPQSAVLLYMHGRETYTVSCAGSAGPTFLPQLRHKTNSWPCEEAEKMLNWFHATRIHMLMG